MGGSAGSIHFQRTRKRGLGRASGGKGPPFWQNSIYLFEGGGLVNRASSSSKGEKQKEKVKKEEERKALARRVENTNARSTKGKDEEKKKRSSWGRYVSFRERGG